MEDPRFEAGLRELHARAVDQSTPVEEHRLTGFCTKPICMQLFLI